MWGFLLVLGLFLITPVPPRVQHTPKWQTLRSEHVLGWKSSIYILCSCKYFFCFTCFEDLHTIKKYTMESHYYSIRLLWYFLYVDIPAPRGNFHLKSQQIQRWEDMSAYTGPQDNFPELHRRKKKPKIWKMFFFTYLGSEAKQKCKQFFLGTVPFSPKKIGDYQKKCEWQVSRYKGRDRSADAEGGGQFPGRTVTGGGW